MRHQASFVPGKHPTILFQDSYPIRELWKSDRSSKVECIIMTPEGERYSRDTTENLELTRIFLECEQKALADLKILKEIFIP